MAGSGSLLNKQLIRLRIRTPKITRRGFLNHEVCRPFDVTIHNHQIQSPIPIQVNRSDTEPGHLQTRRPQSGLRRDVAIQAIRFPFPERIRFAVEVGHKQIESTITIEILVDDPHVRLGLSHLINRNTTQHPLFPKSPILLLNPEMIRLHVVGNKKVRAFILIKVGTDESQSAPRGRCQTTGHRDIFKLRPSSLRRPPPVSVKAINGSWKRLRATEVSQPFPITAVTSRQIVDVIHHHEIQPAIAVKIDKAAGGRPFGIRYIGQFRFITKRSISLIHEKPIVPDVGQKHIQIPVVIDITDRNPHPVTGVDQA